MVEDVPAAVVIGLVSSLAIETLKQHLPAWFTGATVALAAFALTIAAALLWYMVGGIPDASSWQGAVQVAVLAYAAGQTFYGAARKVGFQPGGPLATGPPLEATVGTAGTDGAPPDSGVGAGPDPNANGRVVTATYTDPASQMIRAAVQP